MRPPYNLCALTGALQPTAALPIQDLQPLPIDIDRQMIDPTADIAQEELRFEHESGRRLIAPIISHPFSQITRLMSRQATELGATGE